MSERYRPRSLAELVRAVTSSAVGGGLIAIEGGKTKLGWLRAAQGPEVVIDTRGLDGVVEHAQGDMTATVRAGTPLSQLQTALREKGQRLAVDPPLGPDRAATVGGIFSTDDAGPGRIANGSLRDLVIGATVVLSDGTVARSGGKVIKNVAGYDLCKLFCGARGTLGVVAELTVRLHPMPRAEVTLRAPLALEPAAKLALELSSGRLTPTGVTHQDGALWIRFEGPEPFVRAQATLARAQLESRRVAGIELIDTEPSREAWRTSTEGRRARPGETTLACATLPSRVPSLVVRVEQIAAREGLTDRVLADPLLGHTLVHLAPGPREAIVRAVEGIRAHALELRGHVRLRDRPDGLDHHVDPHGPLPSAEPLMRAVKERLDPVGRCMPRRYLPTF